MDLNNCAISYLSCLPIIWDIFEMINARISNYEVRLKRTMRPDVIIRIPSVFVHFLLIQTITNDIFHESLSHVSFFWLIYRLSGIGDVRIFIVSILSWLLHSYGYFCGSFFDIVENGILSL